MQFYLVATYRIIERGIQSKTHRFQVIEPWQYFNSAYSFLSRVSFFNFFKSYQRMIGSGNCSMSQRQWVNISNSDSDSDRDCHSNSDSGSDSDSDTVSDSDMKITITMTTTTKTKKQRKWRRQWLGVSLGQQVVNLS